ncbi:PREDICTED: myosin heavy chain, skeletal muscle, adult-like [Fragaria vesca subsp. vesca]|uniref:myosin heavy chain, skeletal muscle, adult-like n=1 Tax=Fragaria vesca subsp. vesca TaxID=101020 RepID=UPI0002C36B3A|nr:PREDICTED: myosin heavy chain, skeletal muscle, adult-like [Fragaria vesca subsp. vesca]
MEEVCLNLEEWKLEVCKLKKAFKNCLSSCNKIEDCFSSTRKSLETKTQELKAREEAIGLREKQLAETESNFQSLWGNREKELDAIEEVVTQKLVQVDEVTTELDRVSLLVEEKRQELDTKEKRFLEVDKLVRENEKECDLIQNCIEERKRNLRRLEKVSGEMDVKMKSFGEMDVKMKSFRLLEKSMEDWCHKLDLKKKELE